MGGKLHFRILTKERLKGKRFWGLHLLKGGKGKKKGIAKKSLYFREVFGGISWNPGGGE